MTFWGADSLLLGPPGTLQTGIPNAWSEIPLGPAKPTLALSLGA